MEDQPYRNVFADVHSKIKALKERTAAANKDDREPRESKAAEESKNSATSEAISQHHLCIAAHHLLADPIQSGVDFSRRDR